VRLTCWIVGGVTCIVAAIQAAAQPNVAGRELVGAVRDPGGVPIEGAIIEIHGVSARSDSRGAFRLFTSNVDTVTMGIRRLGYAPVSAQLTARNRQWDTVVVEMDPIPQELAAVKASGREPGSDCTTSRSVERWVPASSTRVRTSPREIRPERATSYAMREVFDS
jgi:hypothetical protein